MPWILVLVCAYLWLFLHLCSDISTSWAQHLLSVPLSYPKVILHKKTVSRSSFTEVRSLHILKQLKMVKYPCPKMSLLHPNAKVLLQAVSPMYYSKSCLLSPSFLSPSLPLFFSCLPRTKYRFSHVLMQSNSAISLIVRAPVNTHFLPWAASLHNSWGLTYTTVHGNEPPWSCAVHRLSSSYYVGAPPLLYSSIFLIKDCSGLSYYANNLPPVLHKRLTKIF